MKPRQQRMLAVGLAAVGIIIATALTLRAFQEYMMFFVEISEVEKGNYPEDRNFRVGGLVVDGSVQREPGELEVSVGAWGSVRLQVITPADSRGRFQAGSAPSLRCLGAKGRGTPPFTVTHLSSVTAPIPLILQGLEIAGRSSVWRIRLTLVVLESDSSVAPLR